MGTSTSHPGGLVPPWADGINPPRLPDGPPPPILPAPGQPDPLPDGDDPRLGGDGPSEDDGQEEGEDEGKGAGEGRPNLKPFRRKLRSFANTGEREHLAKAIRQYGRAFRPKGAASPPSSAMALGAGVIRAFGQIAAGEAPDVPGFRLDELEGKPIEVAAALLIQALAPAAPGFEDEIAQGAMADAVSLVLGDGPFSAAAVRRETVGRLVCVFLTELVFKFLWLEVRLVAEGLPSPTARHDLETAGREVCRSVVERACDEGRCGEAVGRTSKEEIALLLRDLASEAARYMGDYRCD